MRLRRWRLGSNVQHGVMRKTARAAGASARVRVRFTIGRHRYRSLSRGHLDGGHALTSR